MKFSTSCIDIVQDNILKITDTSISPEGHSTYTVCLCLIHKHALYPHRLYISATNTCDTEFCMCVFFLKRQIIKREQHSEAEHLHKHNGKQVQHSRVGGWLHLHNHNKCVLIKRISFIMFKIVHKMIFLSCERQLHPGKIV